MVNMRPSWPPPSKPKPGAGSNHANLRSFHRRQLSWRFHSAASCERGGTHPASDGQQRRQSHRQHCATANRRRVDSARFADGERGDRDALWHLDDRQQRIETLQVAAREPAHARTGTGWSSLASMPGRCAAPPAPAMMQSQPAPVRPLCSVVGTSRPGVRCADSNTGFMRNGKLLPADVQRAA